MEELNTICKASYISIIKQIMFTSDCDDIKDFDFKFFEENFNLLKNNGLNNKNIFNVIKKCKYGFESNTNVFNDFMKEGNPELIYYFLKKLKINKSYYLNKYKSKNEKLFIDIEYKILSKIKVNNIKKTNNNRI